MITIGHNRLDKKKNVVLSKKQKNQSHQLHILNFVVYLDPMGEKEDNNRNYKRRGIFILKYVVLKCENSSSIFK
jgi:hypothetical protein